MNYRTEDEVRDSAKLILGFDKTEPKVKQGTGQITTFNQLGFKGIIDKPDGWYLPDDKGICLNFRQNLMEPLTLIIWKNILISKLLVLPHLSHNSDIEFHLRKGK